MGSFTLNDIGEMPLIFPALNKTSLLGIFDDHQRKIGLSLGFTMMCFVCVTASRVKVQPQVAAIMVLISPRGRVSLVFGQINACCSLSLLTTYLRAFPWLMMVDLNV